MMIAFIHFAPRVQRKLHGNDKAFASTISKLQDCFFSVIKHQPSIHIPKPDARAVPFGLKRPAFNTAPYIPQPAIICASAIITYFYA
ncbi:Uncharacterised protein [Mycobacteroides abscessus subsp. abscessus]|nr:Uncharacterised protein [Mycobacteroides abscessus subsp. abscessus]